MKKILTTFKKMMFVVLAIFAFANVSKAQAPTTGQYKLSVTNELQTAPNVYQFDVYLLSTSSVPFRLAGVQFGLFIDPTVRNGGLITPSIMAGSTQLNAAQTPTTLQFVNNANPVLQNCFNLAARGIPATAVEGSLIATTSGGCTSPGTRIATFVVTNSVPFAANSHSNSVFTTAAASGKTNTIVSAYDLSTNNAFNITAASSNLALGGVGTCYQNIALNFVCPTITLTPAAGAFAGGTVGSPYAGATVTASGGTAPYAYSVSAGSLPAGLSLNGTTGVISGTPTGPAGNSTFSVTATASGQGSCTGTAAYSINVVCPTITLTPAAGALAGGTIGSPYAGATVTASGGTAPYVYSVSAGSLPAGLSLDGSTGVISGTPTGPAANASFTVTATSATGSCTGSAAYSINVVNGCNVTGSGTTTAVSCFGSTDGTAQITLTGTGSAAVPGTYTLDGNPAGAYAANPFTVTGLSAGSHTIVATTGSGCISASIVVSVGNTALLTGSAGTITPVSCATLGTAVITLSASTSGTYTVDGNPGGSYSSNPFTITGLAAGSHTVVATSAAGCVSSDVTFTVGSTSALAGTGTTTPVTCGGGGNNGTATITLTGGSTQAPGTYSLDGGLPTAYAANPFTINSLSSGNHSIVVTAGGCTTAAILVNVGAPATFSATYVKTNLSACSGTPDGTITVTPAGGSGNYSYSWTGVTGSGNPATTPFTAGNVSSLTGLNYGFYNVTITDVGGCGVVTINNIHVEFAFTVVVSNSGTNSSVCGSTGSITLYGNAGIQPYTYSLSAGGPFQASNTFTGLAAGSYTGYVKDAGGCVGTKSITVSSAPAIVVNPFVRNASSCSPDGSIEVYRTGGTPPYSYSKDGGTTFQLSYIFSGLAAGSYAIVVKDAAGCTGTANAVVGAGVGLTATISKVNTSTCLNDGSIQVTPAGGTAPYTYSNDGGTTYQASNSFSGLGAGNYTIKVKDSKGCTSGNINVTINLNTIVVTASVVNATSCLSNNGQVQLFRTGGYGPYTYSLDGNTYQASTIFTGVAAGTYTGYVKDSKTCIGTLSNIVVGPTGCAPVGPIATKTNAKVLPHTTAELKIQAYPNPSTAEFTLVLQGYDSKEKVSVTITDVLGRKVYQTEGTGKLQYKFGNGFIAGIYSVQVIQGNEKKSLKLVKE